LKTYIPDVSADWLLLGRGEMIYDPDSSQKDLDILRSKLTDKENMIVIINKFLDEKDERIKMLIDQIEKKSK